MDKFEGINRADITATTHSCEIIGGGKPKYSCFSVAPKSQAENDEVDYVENASIQSDYKADYDYDYLRSFVRPRDNSKGKADEVSADKYSGEIGEKSAAKSGKKGKRGVFAALRYGLCAAVLLVCLLGKFTTLSSIKTASGFIKDELSRDIVTEIFADDEK